MAFELNQQSSQKSQSFPSSSMLSLSQTLFLTHIPLTWCHDGAFNFVLNLKLISCKLFLILNFKKLLIYSLCSIPIKLSKQTP